MNYGGASTSTQHLHQGLRWFFGIAAVVTDLGHVLLVDLCLDDLSCNQSELDASGEKFQRGSDVYYAFILLWMSVLSVPISPFHCMQTYSAN